VTAFYVMILDAKFSSVFFHLNDQNLVHICLLRNPVSWLDLIPIPSHLQVIIELVSKRPTATDQSLIILPVTERWKVTNAYGKCAVESISYLGPWLDLHKLCMNKIYNLCTCRINSKIWLFTVWVLKILPE
jgi:hypothetical protein